MSQEDPSHNPYDANLTQTQHRAMPKPNKVDTCMKAGVKTCPDPTCILNKSGCPISQRQRIEMAKPTRRS